MIGGDGYRWIRRGWLALTLAAVAMSTPVAAQLEVSSSTVDGGGGTSTGGSFEVSGTVGQFDAGVLFGGTFDLEGGFWTSENPAVPVELMIFEIVSSHSTDDVGQISVPVAGASNVRACRAGTRDGSQHLLPEGRHIERRPALVGGGDAEARRSGTSTPR